MGEKTAIITGACGLVGSAAVEMLSNNDEYNVIGIDNDMRRYFFGDSGSTAKMLHELGEKDNVKMHTCDIRNTDVLSILFKDIKSIDLIIHAAAQPSHDWAAKEPLTDFGVNAVGTLNMLELAREFCPEATFCHISTSKVYGDNPNRLPLEELDTRYEINKLHRYAEGIDTSMSIDNCLHSLFGVSKASGDLLVQEYGRYFDMPTVCFRPGCVTGSNHAGVELHGFLSYLVKCGLSGRKYSIFGYEGKQVRCNIHADDLIEACLAFHKSPRPGSVYNIGGGRDSAISILEAIDLVQQLTEKEFNYTYIEKPRIGDHIWWISDNYHLSEDYEWFPQNSNVNKLIEEIYDAELQ